MASQPTYPVKLEARLDDHLSRWLWLVKWFLVIPHYVVLAFLWMAFALLSVVAFFSILFTSRYPKPIFEFNVGVLRWSWRVAYYSYGALATDRYPPFTIHEVEDYPVHLSIDYPERLSRGLVLIKWWLLAIPHYIVVGLLMGGAWITVRGDNWEVVGFGLIGILTLVAGVVLAFTGRYPHGLFDLLLGLNRWVIRVAAYAGLMTDAYPPFRLDLGGNEPGTQLSFDDTQSPPSRTRSPSSQGWSAGPVLALAFGSLITLISLGLMAGGGAVVWADQTQREGGFVTSPTFDLSTDAYAIVTENIEIHTEGPGWVLPEAILGDARVRVSSSTETFVGVAPTAAVRQYLTGVPYSFAPDLSTYDGLHLATTPGEAPPSPPADQGFWIASNSGPGTQSIRWAVTNGAWSIVVMNADGSRGIDIKTDVGAEAPVLDAVGWTLLGFGVVLLIIGIAFIAGAIRRAERPAREGAFS